MDITSKTLGEIFLEKENNVSFGIIKEGTRVSKDEFKTMVTQWVEDNAQRFRVYLLIQKYQQVQYAVKACAVYGLNCGFDDARKAREALNAFGEMLMLIREKYLEIDAIDKEKKQEKAFEKMAKGLVRECDNLLKDWKEWLGIEQFDDKSFDKMFKKVSCGFIEGVAKYAHETGQIVHSLLDEIKQMDADAYAKLQQQANLSMPFEAWSASTRDHAEQALEFLRTIETMSTMVWDSASGNALKDAETILSKIAQWRRAMVYAYLTFTPQTNLLLQSAVGTLSDWQSRRVGVVIGAKDKGKQRVGGDGQYDVSSWMKDELAAYNNLGK